MITIDEFIVELENSFEEIEKGTLNAETPIEEAIELSSLNMLLILAFFKTEFDLNIQAKQVSACRTIADLFELVRKETKP